MHNKFATGGLRQVSEILKNKRGDTGILVGGNAKDNQSPHETEWLKSVPVASCPRILVGSGSLSPVIAIGRLDIQRSLAIFLLAQFCLVPNKLNTTEAHISCNTSYSFGLGPGDVIVVKVPEPLAERLVSYLEGTGVNRRYRGV